MLDVIANPTLASILLSLGVLGILYELSSPGIGVAGIVGTICLVLALVALSTLAAGARRVRLCLAGIVAIAVEVKAPSHGALAAGGVVALVLGALDPRRRTTLFRGGAEARFSHLRAARGPLRRVVSRARPSRGPDHEGPGAVGHGGDEGCARLGQGARRHPPVVWSSSRVRAGTPSPKKSSKPGNRSP